MVESALRLTQAIDGMRDEDIERLANVLAQVEVVPALHGVTELRRRLYQMEKALRMRVVAEQLLSGGEQWTAPDGTQYVWTGDRERVCDDPALLKQELSELPLSAVAKSALKETFKDQPMKVYLTHLDRIEKWGGEEAGRVIRAHISWKEGSPKLRALDEEKR